MSMRFKKKKKYNPCDPTLDLVGRKDDLDPFSSEDGDLRAVMSCGHAVYLESLTLWCRSQLDQGIYKFRCPALGEGTKLCNKEWSYKEVRRLAVLSVSEMRDFEETMARLAAADLGVIQRMFSHASITRMSMRFKKKKIYNPRDPTLDLVGRKDDLDPFSSEDGDLRAVMSCGHAVSPESLTLWCRSQLDQEIYKFRCPALGEGTKLCNKEWSYKEVRRKAVLSVLEMRDFEETIARLAAADLGVIQRCPQCNTYVEREDLSNLCVQCTVCTADHKKKYHFCWQCLREWKGRAPRSDRCDNDGCANKDLHFLQVCPTISLSDVEGVPSCPSVRACPTCGMRVQHNQQNCKNIHCPRCQVPFCFLCLKLKRECNQTSSPYKLCQGGLAPRQTSIPVWNRK